MFWSVEGYDSLILHMENIFEISAIFWELCDTNRSSTEYQAHDCDKQRADFGFNIYDSIIMVVY